MLNTLKGANDKRRRRRFFNLRAAIVLVTVLLVIIHTAAGESFRTPRDEGDDTLVVGFTGNVFADVHIPDALAALKVWAGEVKRIRGLTGLVETRVFRDTTEIEATVSNQAVDVLILTASEYLELPSRAEIEPRFVHLSDGKFTEDSILLVHRGSGIDDFSDLRGKAVHIMNHVRTNSGKIWLEILSCKAGVRKLEEYFSDVQYVEKSSKAVLPVFFKKADACLIHRGGFETISELNPQVRRELKIIASSPETVSSVTCVRKGYDPSRKDVVIDALSRLPEEPRGQQILLLFKIEGMVPFRDSYLDGMRDLLEQLYVFRNKTGQLKKKAGF